MVAFILPNSDGDELIRRANAGEDAALLELGSFATPAAVAAGEWFIQQVLDDDFFKRNAARSVLARLREGSPLHLELRKRAYRDFTVWFEKWLPYVQGRFKSLLYGLQPADIEDEVQKFWSKFWEQDQSHRFDPVKAAEIKFLNMRIDRQVIDCLRARKHSQSHEAEPPEKEPPREPPDFGLVHHIHFLITINRLKPKDAIVLLCLAWGELGPGALAKRHLDQNLFQLLEQVRAQTNTAFDENDSHAETYGFPRPDPSQRGKIAALFRTLGDQLNLPIERPLGQSNLGELIAEQGRDSNKTLEDWLEQARKVLGRGSRIYRNSGKQNLSRGASLTKEIHDRLKKEFTERISTLCSSLLGSRIHNAMLLAWAYQRILHNPVTLLGLSCRAAAENLRDRIHELLPEYTLDPSFVQRLTGEKGEVAVGSILRDLETDVDKAVHAVEQHLRRARSKELDA